MLIKTLFHELNYLLCLCFIFVVIVFKADTLCDAIFEKDGQIVHGVRIIFLLKQHDHAIPPECTRRSKTDDHFVAVAMTSHSQREDPSLPPFLKTFENQILKLVSLEES